VKWSDEMESFNGEMVNRTFAVWRRRQLAVALLVGRLSSCALVPGNCTAGFLVGMCQQQSA
jgi:hypothetical protein